MPLPLHHTLPLPLSTLLWIGIGLVVVSQIRILLSTVRAMRGAQSERARRGIEWAYAVVPAIALMVALVFTWQAAREHAMRVDMESRASQTEPS